MIAHLQGTLLEKTLDRVIVDVGGVGYQVYVSLMTLSRLPAAGEVVQLRCYTHVREDVLQVFGFVEAEEKQAFELLISVSGIGPKLALTILSGMTVRDLLDALVAGDHKRLQTIPGVGKKTAERMVVDLRDRCTKLELPLQGRDAGRGRIGREVVDALVNLGYKKSVAEKAVERVIEREAGAELSPEGLLRAALATFAEL